MDAVLRIAGNLQYISQEQYNTISIEIETLGKLLNGLIKYLKIDDK
ncbi:four helix bundle protein [Kaistella haifensis]|nr:four helix bundle protein [Kaistella haifensis]